MIDIIAVPHLALVDADDSCMPCLCRAKEDGSLDACTLVVHRIGHGGRASLQKSYDVGFEASAVLWTLDGTQLIVSGDSNERLVMRYGP